MPSLILTRKPLKDTTCVAHVYGSGPHAGEYLCIDEHAYGGAKRIELMHGEHFGIEPTHFPDQRDCSYATGSSGSGKSHMALQFARRYAQLWPSRPIVLFSALSEDATLDQLKPRLKRIAVKSLVEKPFSLEEVNGGALLIFDDCESALKVEAEALQRTLELALTTGRHKAVSVFTISHVACNGKSTRVQLLEAHGYLTFSGNSYHSQRYILQNYAGLSNKQLQELRKIKSRWVYVRKLYPTLVLADGEADLINEDAD